MIEHPQPTAHQAETADGRTGVKYFMRKRMNDLRFYFAMRSIEDYLDNAGIEYTTTEDGIIDIPEISVDDKLYRMRITADEEIDSISFLMDLGVVVSNERYGEVLKFTNLANNNKRIGYFFIDAVISCFLQRTDVFITLAGSGDEYWENFIRQMATDYIVYASFVPLITDLKMGGVEVFADLVKMSYEC